MRPRRLAPRTTTSLVQDRTQETNFTLVMYVCFDTFLESVLTIVAATVPGGLARSQGPIPFCGQYHPR